MSTELVKRIAAYLRATSERDITLYDGHPSVLLHEAADELTALTAKVALLTEALKPFATVAPHGTFGGPLVCLTPIYEDGSDKWYSPSPLIGPEALRAARRALSEPDKEGML